MSVEWLRQPNDEDGRDSSGKTAVARWVAAGPLTTQEAAASTLPVNYNDPHPDEGTGDPRRCERIRIIATGFRVMLLEARFSVPTWGAAEHRDDQPAISHPTVLSWQTVQETIPIDRDRDGNAILTSAHRAVQGVNQTRNYKRLTITRWEPGFSVATAQLYENAVNADTFQGGPPGTVKCSEIQPSQSYSVLDALIPIDYVFDFKAESLWGEQPHQTIFLDQDSYAIADGKLVRLVTPAGDPVTDTPMNGQGVPLDSSITYFEAAGDEEPVESPSFETRPTPAGAQVLQVGDVVFLRYNTLPARNLGRLG